MQNEPAQRQPLRLTRAQVREIDRRAIQEYNLPGIVLMENAARAVVDVAMDMLRGVNDPAVLIFCGGGNNGGDGLAVARHLHNRGVSVELALAVDPASYTGDAKINWDVVRAMNIPRTHIDRAMELAKVDWVVDGLFGAGEVDVDLVVDALFGTGLAAPPRTPWHVGLVNQHDVPVLAVDVPSGLDCDTGRPLGPRCVRATRTVTFVAEKVGFANPEARPYLGEVTVGDIGCPRELVEMVARENRPA
jgi:NAD(P)H-hydrate epimerase